MNAETRAIRDSPHPPAAASGPVSESASAFSATLARLHERRWRMAAFVGALCLGIAFILHASGGRFWTQLLYSSAVGVSCTTVIEGTRLLAAYVADRIDAWRRLRSLPDLRSAHGKVWYRGWRLLLPALLLGLLLGPAIGFWLGDLLTGLRSPGLLQFDNPSTRTTLTITALASTLAVVVGAAIERLATARALAEAAQRQAAENQLRLLQSQLEPHMLFNTLANLRVLIGLDPTRAQAMLDHLIAFLRTTLAASRADVQTLGTEFSHLHDYLALMAVRMGTRLQVTLSLPPDLAGVTVPPLLLQPLVENSIQHGLEPKIEGGRIDVQARRDGDELVLVVRDTGVGRRAASPSGHDAAMAPSPSSGFGVLSTRQRLQTLHGRRASLVFDDAPDTEGGTRVTIRLPLGAGVTGPRPSPPKDPA